MVRLYTLHEGGHEPRAAALFVHGLDGDPEETWNFHPRSRRTLWPVWLKETLPDLAVHSIEYEASISRWGNGHALGIEERAASLRSYLTAELKPGRRLHGLPLILITHSMGGLIAKAMLRKSSLNPNRDPKDLLEQTCGVIFIATPHAGSDLAWWAEVTAVATRPTQAVRDMLQNDPELRSLNAWYRNHAKEYGIRSYAFYETKDTNGLKVVDAASADPAIEGVEATPIDTDHIDIAKPVDDLMPLYVETVAFLEDILGDIRSGAGTGEVVEWAKYNTYRSVRENAFPACVDLHVKARTSNNQDRLSTRAIMRCGREPLRSDDGWIFRLGAQSTLMTLKAQNGEISPDRGLGDDDDSGRYKYDRGPFDRITISPNDSAEDLEGLVLDDSALPGGTGFRRPSLLPCRANRCLPGRYRHRSSRRAGASATERPWSDPSTSDEDRRRQGARSRAGRA